MTIPSCMLSLQESYSGRSLKHHIHSQDQREDESCLFSILLNLSCPVQSDPKSGDGASHFQAGLSYAN